MNMKFFIRINNPIKINKKEEAILQQPLNILMFD